MAILPGFVNAHYHSYDTLVKGLIEDAPFDVWVVRVLGSVAAVCFILLLVSIMRVFI